MPDLLLKFNFSSPLRIGREEIDLQGIADGLHSDTLFSAVCHTLAELYGHAWVDEWLSKYCQKPDFLLSSAFPYYQNTCFLPRPYLPAPEGVANASDPKFFKKLRWISVAALTKWLHDNAMDVEVVQGEHNSTKSAFIEYTLPRVALDRVTNASNIYYCSQLSFQPQGGLYCLLRLINPDFQAVLEGAFAYLGECGLGSERSNGYGRFEPVWENPGADWATLLKAQGDRHYLLSLYHPKEDEKISESAQYGLLHRRGWFYSVSTGKQYKRRSAWMLQEGSILVAQPQGHLLDVTPSVCSAEHHRIFRCGLALSLQF